MKRLYPITLLVLLLSPFVGSLVLTLLASPDAVGPHKGRVDLLADLAKDTDLSGYYLVEGVQGGKRYEGMTSLVRVRNVYVVNWTIPGGQSFDGVGLLTGKTFSVGWATKGGSKGVTVYELDGTTLKGRWGHLPSDGLTCKETLTLIRRRAKPLANDD